MSIVYCAVIRRNVTILCEFTTIHKIFASHLMVLCAHKIQATQEIKDNTVGQMMVMYVDKVICLCAQL